MTKLIQAKRDGVSIIGDDISLAATADVFSERSFGASAVELSRSHATDAATTAGLTSDVISELPVQVRGLARAGLRSYRFAAI